MTGSPVSGRLKLLAHCHSNNCSKGHQLCDSIIVCTYVNYLHVTLNFSACTYKTISVGVDCKNCLGLGSALWAL